VIALRSIRQRAQAKAVADRHALFLRQHARQERRVQIDMQRWRAPILDRIATTLENWPNSNPVAGLVWQPTAEDERSFRAMIRRALVRMQLAGASLESQYLDTALGRDQSKQSWRQLQGRFRSERQIAPVTPVGNELDPDDIYIEFSPEMRTAVDTWTSAREVGLWQKIQSGTSRALSKAISTGLAEGLSIDDLMKAVMAEITEYDKVQARRVARTEATGAMNHGAYLEQVDAEVPFREWLRTIDLRTRGFNPDKKEKFNHYNANQVVPATEPCVVSGERMNYPGDTTFGASAGNVINCRCSCAANFEGPKKRRATTPRSKAK
jgi:uncharacterized protein with gpF-like domain